MTVRWWGPGGSNGADGLSFANRKLTAAGVFTGGFGQPGDVLNFSDGDFNPIGVGTGTGTLDLSAFTYGGSLGNPFIMQAGQTEGGPIFDGRNVGKPVRINADFTTITGINACRGETTVNNQGGNVAVVGGNGLAVKRAVFWDAGYGHVSGSSGNGETCRVGSSGKTYGSHYGSGFATQGVLMEDICTFGQGRYSYGVNQFYDGYCRTRRLYAEWMFSDEDGPKAAINAAYLAGGDVGHYDWEDCVGVFSAWGWPQQPATFNLWRNGVVIGTIYNDHVFNDTGPWGTYMDSQHAELYILGCVGITTTPCVDAANHQVLYIFGTQPVTIQDWVSFTDPAYPNDNTPTSFTNYLPVRLLAQTGNPFSGGGTGLSATRLSLLGGSQGPVGTMIAGVWAQSAIYQSPANNGKGAANYGATESIYNTLQGAKLLNRYTDRVLTTTNRWPLPMSQRMKDASTLAKNSGYNNGTFTHRIIDFDTEWQNRFGAYPGVTSPVSISPVSIPNGTQDAPYSQVLTATGGTGPYTFAISAGALPAGMSITSGGTLTGTPSVAGVFTFTVRATDSLSATGINSYTISITASGGGGGGGVVAFRSSSTGNAASASTLVINKPAGTVDGDVMLCHISTTNSAPTISPPAGWTQLAKESDAFNCAATYRRVASGEGSSYTFTLNASSTGAALIVTYTGVDNVTPEDVATTFQSTLSAAQIALPAITTVTNNAMIVYLYDGDQNSLSGTWTQPPGTTERVDFPNVASCIGVSELLKVTAGATAATHADGTQTSNAGYGHTVALRPGSAVVIGRVGAAGQQQATGFPSSAAFGGNTFGRIIYL